MNKILSILILSIVCINISYSQDLNFDKVDYYDSISEIKHYEILHWKNNDTNLLNHFLYNSSGNLIEKRYQFRTVESHYRHTDSGLGYWVYDTVGTREKPKFTSIKYEYNTDGFLIKKKYLNSLYTNVLDGLYIENTVVSKCKNLDKTGKHISSVLTYKYGNIETHYYTYENNRLISKRIYSKEKLYKTVFYEYKFYKSE